MREEVVVKNNKELSKDQKVIRSWLAVFVSVILCASIIVGSVFLRANNYAKEIDRFSKEEAVAKAESYLLDRSSAYRKQTYEKQTKTELVFTLGNMEEAYHVYKVTFKSETITAVVEVNAKTKVASLKESNIK